MKTVIKHGLLAGSFLWGIALTGGCVSQGSYDSLQARNAQLEEQNAAQSKQLEANQAQLAANQVQITRLQGAIKYTIESDLLFPTGSWKISDDGKEIISKMAKKLAPTQTNTLVVNGYTDDAPIGADLQKQGVTSNQDLSEKRAQAVKEVLVKNGIPENKVIAVGHGESNPVAKNDTEMGRSQNRRVELTQKGG